MPDEITPAGGGEVEPDPDVVVNNDDDEPIDIEVDERGVPTKNVYAEFMRKLKRIERGYAKQLEVKDQQIRDLQTRAPTPLTTPEPVATKPETPKFTKEELFKAFQEAAGDPALQAVIVDKMIDLRQEETVAATRAQGEVQQKQNVYNQMALQQYPQLADQGSEFYRQVALSLEQRVRGGLVGPTSIYDAANEIAARRPDLLKQPNTPERRRGFSEAGGTRPVKPEDSGVKLDPDVFKRYKTDYPQLSEERVKTRAAELTQKLFASRLVNKP